MVDIKLDKKNVVDRKNIHRFIHELRKLFFKEIFYDPSVDKCNKARHLFLKYIDNNKDAWQTFYEAMKNIKVQLHEDLKFFLLSDPAANNAEEVIMIYPGFKAIRYYRIAHQLYIQGYKVVARTISEQAHNKTGIDIHPGANIDYPFFIDHGTGIVIGETATIGKNCKIYQGVTLGAKSLGAGHKLKDVKRHPTIGDNVTIYSNASLLGGDLIIGNNVVIGSNVYLVSKTIEDNHLVILEEPTISLIKKSTKKLEE